MGKIAIALPAIIKTVAIKAAVGAAVGAGIGAATGKGAGKGAIAGASIGAGFGSPIIGAAAGAAGAAALGKKPLTGAISGGLSGLAQGGGLLLGGPAGAGIAGAATGAQYGYLTSEEGQEKQGAIQGGVIGGSIGLTAGSAFPGAFPGAAGISGTTGAAGATTAAGKAASDAALKTAAANIAGAGSAVGNVGAQTAGAVNAAAQQAGVLGAGGASIGGVAASRLGTPPPTPGRLAPSANIGKQLTGDLVKSSVPQAAGQIAEGKLTQPKEGGFDFGALARGAAGQLATTAFGPKKPAIPEPSIEKNYSRLADIIPVTPGLTQRAQQQVLADIDAPIPKSIDDVQNEIDPGLVRKINENTELQIQQAKRTFNLYGGINSSEYREFLQRIERDKQLALSELYQSEFARIRKERIESKQTALSLGLQQNAFDLTLARDLAKEIGEEEELIFNLKNDNFEAFQKNISDIFAIA